jgi:hypothetical protein
MSWILVGIIGGSLITSTFDNREACEGRAVVLRETKGVVAKCIKMPDEALTSGNFLSCFNGPVIDGHC